ncbi:hypothetical protein [Franzmannia pantelleriensis]|uniref:hypothetical protein n=1 Tax=Franzmannia pantelleriensis TaxID=48727 RepID=UPI003BEF1686
MALVSGGDQSYRGARLDAGQDLALLSGGNIAFDMASDLRQESHERSKSNFVRQSASGEGTTRETLRQNEVALPGRTGHPGRPGHQHRGGGYQRPIGAPDRRRHGRGQPRPRLAAGDGAARRYRLAPRRSHSRQLELLPVRPRAGRGPRREHCRRRLGRPRGLRLARAGRRWCGCRHGQRRLTGRDRRSQPCK